MTAPKLRLVPPLSPRRADAVVVLSDGSVVALADDADMLAAIDAADTARTTLAPVKRKAKRVSARGERK